MVEFILRVSHGLKRFYELDPGRHVHINLNSRLKSSIAQTVLSTQYHQVYNCIFTCRRPVHTRWRVRHHWQGHRELWRVHQEGETRKYSRIHSGTEEWLLTGTGVGRWGAKARQIVAVGEAHDRFTRTRYGLSCPFFSPISVTLANKTLQLAYGNDGFDGSKFRGR